MSTSEWSRMRLPFGPGAATAARRRLDETLVEQHVPVRRRQDAAVVMHELIANTLEHGRPDEADEIEARWSIADGQLLLAVYDGGSAGSVASQHPTTDQPSGRGLALVDAMSLCWSVDRSHGTWVSACLTLDD